MQQPDFDTPTEIAVAESTTGSVRARLLSGLTWAAGYQAFEVAVAFGAMLITVRLIPPGEYGRATATAGFLAALNTIASGLFVSHALQLPEGQEPDWTLHLGAAVYIQGALFAVCELAACAAWFSTVYRSIALLLHVAGVGLLLMAPNQVAITKLYRELDFPRLKVVSALCTVSKLTVTVGLALTGHGALAIICGNNVVSCIPFGADLLVVQRWRPGPGWWRPRWREYREPLAFGFQRLGAVLVGGVRDAIEAAVLPATIGFGVIGLVGRANGIYSTTVGRLESLVIDTAYPFLPRAAGNPERYARRAMLLVQTALFILIPAAFFIALEGPSLSRVLYGRKWINADPLILPATVAGVALTISSLSTSVLLGAGRLRRSLQIETLIAAFAAAAVVGAVIGRAAPPYLWTMAGGNVITAVVAAGAMSPLLPRRWVSRSAIPAIASSAAGAVVVWLAHAGVPARPLYHVAVVALLFGFVTAAMMRLAFARVLVSLCDALEWDNWPRRVLLLPDRRSGRLRVEPT